MVDAAGTDLMEMWRRQIDEGTQAWLRMVGQPPMAGAPAALDPQAFWKPFMDQGIAAWSKVMTQGPASPELMTQWKQFLDQWIAAWSRALEQAMGTESFAKLLGKQLEGFLAGAGPAKKAAAEQQEAGLAGLGMPSRAQVTGIAQQIVQLEEKIEGVEDRLDAVLARLEALGAGPRPGAR